MSNFFQLTVVSAPDPGTHAIIDYDGPGAKVVPTGESEGRGLASRDSETVDLYCGQCGALVATHMASRSIANAILRCKFCRAFNGTSSIG